MNLNWTIISNRRSRVNQRSKSISIMSFFVYRPRRPPSAPAASPLAGRVTKPQRFSLTNSTTMGNVHRKKCMHQIEEEKLQREIEDELLLNRSFKGNYSSASCKRDLLHLVL